MAIDLSNPGPDEEALALAIKNIIAGTIVEFVPVTGSRNFLDSDNGKILELSNAVDATVTITMQGTMPKGFQCGIFAGGEGDVFVAQANGAVNLSTIDDETVVSQMTAQNGLASVLVVRNTNGSTAQFVVKGDAA